MDKSKDCCPYCNKNHCVDNVAYSNAEAYGNSSFRMECVYCHKPIYVYLHRMVYCGGVSKSDHKSSKNDF